MDERCVQVVVSDLTRKFVAAADALPKRQVGSWIIE